jgi:hypothetical protein
VSTENKWQESSGIDNSFTQEPKKKPCKITTVIYNCDQSIDEWVQPIIGELSELSGVRMKLESSLPNSKQAVGIFMVNVCTSRIDEDINPILLENVCKVFEKVVILVMRSGKKRMERINGIFQIFQFSFE